MFLLVSKYVSHYVQPGKGVKNNNYNKNNGKTYVKAPTEVDRFFYFTPASRQLHGSHKIYIRK